MSPEIALLWTDINCCDDCNDAAPYLCHAHAVELKKIDAA